MSGYVGMDVHRKRSQVAIVDAAGAQQGNRNVPNDPAQLVPILGALPPGTPVAFEAAYGWGWRVGLLEELELEPHLVHPSRCKAIASARLKKDKVDAATLAQLLRADLLPRPGSHLRPPGICGPCCVTGPPWCGCRPPAEPGPCGARRPRHRGPLEPVDRSRASLAGRPGAAGDPTGDHPGLLWAAGRPGHPDRPAGPRDRRTGQARSTSPGAHGPPRNRQADGHDPGRRDR
jgi:hypothetical protein